MEEIGIVKSIEGVNARVMISLKGSPCESCIQDACTVPEKGIETEAINAARAKVGQKVKVVVSSYTYLKGAMLIYALPVVALIAGAILGKIHLPRFFSGTDSDLLAAAGGFFLFLLSLILIKLAVKRMDRKTEYKSVIESIVE